MSTLPDQGGATLGWSDYARGKKLEGKRPEILTVLPRKCSSIKNTTSASIVLYDFRLNYSKTPKNFPFFFNFLSKWFYVRCLYN
jgi:hypothetical protein